MEKFYFFLRFCYAKAYLKIWGRKWGSYEVDSKSATYPWIFCIFILIPIFKLIQDVLENGRGKLNGTFLVVEIGFFILLFIVLIIIGSNKEKKQYYNSEFTKWYESDPGRNKSLVILTLLSPIV